MNWGKLKKLTSSLLSGDTPFPSEDEDAAIVLLEYALEQIALSSYSSNLVSGEPVLYNTVRITDDGEYIRRPNLPSSDSDIIDIDKGLTFVAARLMASYLTRSENSSHYFIAKSMMEKHQEMIVGIREALMIVNYKELMSPGVTNENGSCDRILGLNQSSDCSAKKMLFISQVANIIDMEHIITLDIGNVPTIDQTIMLIYVDENGDRVEEELVDGKQIVKKMNLSDGILSSDFKFSVFSSSNTNYCDFDVSLSEDLLSYFVLSKDATGNIQLENNWNVDGVSIVTGGYEWRLNGTLLPSTATSSWIVDSEIRRTGVIGENILEATLVTGSKFKYTYMYDPSILDMLLTQDDVIVGTDIFYNIVPSAKQVQGIEYSLFKNNSKIVNDAFTDNINDTFQLVAFETANNDSSIQTFDRNAYDSYYYFIEKTTVSRPRAKISDILFNDSTIVFSIK